MAAKFESPRHQANGSNSRVGQSLLHKLAPAKFVRCVVEMLDDSHSELDIEVRSSGSVLFKKIINELNLAEPDYFGLQFFRDSSSKPVWLEHDKVIKRQLKGQAQPYKFAFGVRFFPTEPSRVAEDLTRYHIFLSVKKDLRNGRLSCPNETAAELSSLVVQSETGDFLPNYAPEQYISDYQLIPNQTPEFEERVFHYHKENIGLSPAQAELKFLEIAKRLELYGCEVQKAKDSDGYDIEIVVCSEGIKIYRDNKRLNIFSWARIEKVLFNRKHFYVQLLPDIDKDPESKTVVGFILPSLGSCKSLWKITVAHHTFYRRYYRDRFSERPKLIRFGSTYKYRGRTQFQAVEAARRSFRKETAFQRTGSSRQSNRSFGTLAESSLSGRPNPRRHCETESDVTSMSTTRGSYDVLEPSDSDSRSHASLSPVRRHETEMNGILNDEGLLDISIHPNKSGQFGLNFKGGAEQRLKPIITQIAPNSPASLCDPQLQDGDEIVYINGRRAEQLSHDQICCLIRSIGQSATNKTLMLSVRSFGSIENHEIKESSNQVISSQLLTSMAQVKQGLENGDLLEFYVDMPKKKLELATEVAHLPENKTKNRYRDILPYDFNRVVISSGENDYINASHIQMDIGYPGMVNEYLAAQGPLSDTCADFWQMIWDQEVSLVVMLTTTMENGKTKCHRYWPECGENFEIGNFEVSPVSSRDYSPSYIHREMTVTDLATDTERTIRHLQYTAWPDHGVPEDSRQFLTFVNEVRRYRSESTAPIVLHCSAGVGRTGVFIAVETAYCLIEAGVPVYPEQMLDTLRDQRPSLIQTPGQFKFTCEAFLDIYQDYVIKTQSMNGR